MLDLADVQSDFDRRRIERAKELSEVRWQFAAPASDRALSVRSKAIAVLCYAHWEGFYNECSTIYISFLRNRKLNVSKFEWNMILGLLQGDIQQLRDRNHSIEAGCDFVERLSARLEEKFDNFDETIISSKSNLNFSRLKRNFRVMNFDIQPFQKDRIRIDKELVTWRHQVAHGDSPDLSSMDLDDHITFSNSLLLKMSDIFQSELIGRFS